MKTIVIMITISVFLVIAQISLKSSLTVFKNGVDVNSILALAININFIVAVSCIIISAVSWMYVLSYEKISIVYPFMSLSYVFMMIYAHYFLDEFLTIAKMVGMLFIAVGLFLIYQ